MEISAPAAWFILGTALLFLELVMPAFIVFFFGLGGWITALALLLVPLPLLAQVALFLGSSLLLLVALRSRLPGVFTGGRRDEDAEADDLVGGVAVVTAAIRPPAEGRIRYRGSFWRAAAGEPIAEGAVVEVVGRRDMLLTVQPASAGKEEAHE